MGVHGRRVGRPAIVLVEGGGYYYESSMDYLHLNPVGAGLDRLAEGESLLDYPWSSVAGVHALRPAMRPRWLASQDALQAFGCMTNR